MICDDCPGGPSWEERAERAEADRDFWRDRVSELEAEVRRLNGGIDPAEGEHTKLDLFRVDL